MRITSIFICAFSLLSVSLFSQTKPEEKKQDSVKWKYTPNFLVGVDVLNLGTGFFSDRQMIQGFISSRISKKVHAVIDLGYDNNIYQKNGYDAKADGLFAKIGAVYMLSMDPENDMNGFYTGAKLAGSFYNQEYMAVPVKGLNNEGIFLSFDPSTQSSYWIEASLGARVQVFNSNFFIDVNAQPRYLAYTTKQEEIKPMIVPGFGKSSGSFNMGFSWSIAYKF
ncbi:DUF6048 family protein [Epilithonimonas lactis]|uniref:Outer membrane protein beta-barrel domain-containing protein n=1 Tax=Epilithonimonas lactis TaxID=421072 RepID=A0A085B7R2_9FLAO|nr:DUF6048 family protein [Epilithonimonas lactis]KFC18507.1 hypothetical protein IO89_16745 [Epilithonimonas lactis]KFC23159.1 hypothetical protein IO89_00695 [Epilithonimonas lactis]SEQ70771.1 hypothetical protein SAMN04488097_2935 [Epilithonimonas lactis]